MVDPFILGAEWGSLCNLLLRMFCWPFTHVRARLSSLRLAIKREFPLVLCRCCTSCTARRVISTLHCQFQLCWILTTLLLFYWHDFCAFLDDFRDLRVQYFSLSTAVSRTRLCDECEMADEPSLRILRCFQLYLDNAPVAKPFLRTFVASATSLQHPFFSRGMHFAPFQQHLFQNGTLVPLIGNPQIVCPTKSFARPYDEYEMTENINRSNLHCNRLSLGNSPVDKLFLRNFVALATSLQHQSITRGPNSKQIRQALFQHGTPVPTIGNPQVASPAKSLVYPFDKSEMTYKSNLRISRCFSLYLDTLQLTTIFFAMSLQQQLL